MLLFSRWGWYAAAMVAVAGLAGCAAAPPREAASAAPREPLQRIELAVDANRRDALADLLGAELALAQADATTAAQRYLDAARLDGDPAIAEQATHVALASRQWPLAREALLRWQALHGDEAGIRQARAMLALHDGSTDAAYADLDWLTHQLNGWRLVAQALIVADDKAVAGAMLERLLHGMTSGGEMADLGDRPQTWATVAQLAARLDRPDLARALADRAVRRFHDADTYVWAAQAMIQSGDREGARKLLAGALREAQPGKIDPRHPGRDEAVHLRIAYAGLLGDMGRSREAADVLAQGPQNDRTWAARAAYLARGDLKQTRPSLERLYEEIRTAAPPRSPARLQLLGQIAELLGRKPEALKWYAQVPDDDEDGDAWFAAQVRTIGVLNDTGKTDKAFDLAHELQVRQADDPRTLGEAYLVEGDLLIRNKRIADAVAAYDRGLRALPDDTRLLYARALACDEIDRIAEAVRDLRRVLELKPDDADAMNALGYTLADRTDQKTEALGLIEKALALKPGDPAIIDSMGWVQYRLGHLDAAIERLRSAYASQPDAEIAAHLGEVLWVSGRRDEARAIWEQGRKRDGDNRVLLETIKRLTS